MMLKIAVFAPIPSAKVLSVAIVNPGVRARRRSANFTSRSKSYKRESSNLLLRSSMILVPVIARIWADAGLVGGRGGVFIGSNSPDESGD